MKARTVALACGSGAAMFLVVLLLLAILAGAASLAGGVPTSQATQDIPPSYLSLYQAAAETCSGPPWSVLAAIGKVETNHGRLVAPGVTSGTNAAGAAGPMQMGVGVGPAGHAFWRVAVDGNADGRADPYDPADAIPTAAAYLCTALHDNGGDLSQAILAYNHAQWYVQKVLQIAQSYATGEAAPLAAERAVAFAYAQLGTPYQWGGDGENGTFDCSGLTMAAWAAAGVTLPHNAAAQYASAGPHIPDPSQLQPGDLLYFAHDTSDPATIHHVDIYIGAGRIIEAPHTGAPVRIANAFRADYIGATRPSE
jgi:NlpC/P60 family/Transglycosylase SLT domain